nr:GNAT family N-acetyltransferase [Wenzhouxiangella sp. XN79A]
MSTPRLQIRPWRPGDRPALERMALDRDMMRYVTGGEPWSAERIDAFLEDQAAGYRQHGLAFGAVTHRARDRVIGLAGIQPLDSGAFELGWWIWKDHWGQGYATEAAAAVVAHARYALELDRLYAVIDPPNSASIRVAEKLGMVFEQRISARATRAERPDTSIVLYVVRFGGPGPAPTRRQPGAGGR